jgi:putative ABC transport system permease protein
VLCVCLTAVGIALAAGPPLARRLIDAQGRSTGVGAGIAHLPPAGLLAAFAVTAVTGAAVLATFSAARMVRRHRADPVR